MISQKNINNVKIITEGLLKSYAQIFFSNNALLGILIMLVSLSNPVVGLSGILSVVISQVFAYYLKYNEEHIQSGTYSYNSLLVGLGIGIFLQFNWAFVLLLGLASLFTLFISIYSMHRLQQKGLPFLSLPFVIVIWLIYIAVPSFGQFKIVHGSESQMLSWWSLANTYLENLINEIPINDFIHIFLRSIGAIFFQYNDLSGLLILIGIFIYSRISFALCFYGFTAGFLFYQYFHGDFNQLIYSYIGFNFILTAIALGGFFIVPSVKSHITVVLASCFIALLIGALTTLLSPFHLPIYSLPFIIIVLLFLYILKFRIKSNGLQLVQHQQYQPELNFYKNYYYRKKYSQQSFYHIYLPVMGEWHIPQGHNGTDTHKGDWQYAWDFDIIDENNKSYRTPGSELQDFYCYNLPVIAPASGYVVKVEDGIIDNRINEVNTFQNFGNTVIIKHNEHIYIKLSHLKAGSIKVSEGSYVQAGSVIGCIGNSGRSPEPHLHFQIQSTPEIAAKTIKYPIAYYLKRNHHGFELKTFSYPQKDDIVKNITPTGLLTNTFNWRHGNEINWEIKEAGKEAVALKWTVHVNAYNQSYIYCDQTKSYAYFNNDGIMFYFYDFYGSTNSFLYLFYLSAQKILLAHYAHLSFNDWLMHSHLTGKIVSLFQDLLAPFYQFLKGVYHFKFTDTNNEHNPSSICFTTSCSLQTFGSNKRKLNATYEISNNIIKKLNINFGKKTITATCLK